MSGVFGGVDPAAVAALLIAPMVPPTESTAGAAGILPQAPAADHSHPRLTSATYPPVTDASGLTTVNFTRTFAKKPCFLYSVENMDGITVTPVAYTKDANGNYNGCQIRASKRTAGVNLTNAVVALVTVLTGVTASTSDVPVPNALISAVFLAVSN